MKVNLKDIIEEIDPEDEMDPGSEFIPRKKSGWARPSPLHSKTFHINDIKP